MQLAPVIKESEEIMQPDNSIWRSYDFKEINSLIDSRLDASTTIEDNIWLLGEGFSAFFLRKNNGVYEVHIDVNEESRGKRAIQMAKNAIKFIFSKTDCKMIIGAVPVEDKPARLFSRLSGLLFNSRQYYQFARGCPILCDIFILKVEDYICPKN